MTSRVVTAGRPSAAGVELRRMASLLLTAVLWGAGAVFAVAVWTHPHNGVTGIDAHAYWIAQHRAHLYAGAPASSDAFLYSPLFAQVIWPLTRLPWPAFFAVWVAIEAAGLAWLLKPLGWRWGVTLFLFGMLELSVGNIYVLLALALVFGVRFGGTWAFPLLTKVSVGLCGPVWFLARKEWRPLVQCVAVSAGLVGVSAAVAPAAWGDWFAFLFGHTGDSQWYFPVRVAAAVVISAIAARWNKPVLLAPAMLLANPVVIHAWMDLVLLAAIPRLARKPYAPDPKRQAAPASSAMSPAPRS